MDSLITKTNTRRTIYLLIIGMRHKYNIYKKVSTINWIIQSINNLINKDFIDRQSICAFMNII